MQRFAVGQDRGLALSVNSLIKTVIIIVLIVLPSTVLADDAILERSHWSFEIKGGQFIPEIDHWKRYYGKRYMPQYGVSLAYQLWKQIEVGIAAGSITGKGDAFGPLHATSFSNAATYQLYPVNAFILIRGIWSEDQLLVPYIGGGWTRMYYRQEIQEQDTVAGNTDGYHARGGVQLSLDAADPDASNRMYLDYGIRSTYFFVEAEYTRAVVTSVSVNLGGTAYLGGLRFEF